MGEQVTTQAHLTIVDTNDIESITVEYARNQSTSNPPDANTGGWSTTRPTWAQGYYIWQRTRIHKTGTAASADTFGAAVCLTGSTGQTGATGPTGPEAVVTITPTIINWEAGTATLAVTLRVNGVVTTPLTYNWTKGANTNSLGTSSTLTLNGSTNKLDSTYNCTVTW